MSDQRYPYVNTGEVEEVSPYERMTRLRVKFDVLDGTFIGSIFMTVKAFNEAVGPFAALNAGDRVRIHGHIRYDAPTEQYKGGYYVDGREVEVLEKQPQAEKEPDMFKDSTVTTADADVPF